MWVYWGQIVLMVSLSSLSNASALEREKSVENCAGEVVTVRGTVLVRQTDDGSGRAPSSLPLKAGNNVYPGDVINTSSDGAVKILLKDKTIVDLGASSLFKVDKFVANAGSDRQVGLDMMFGKMRIAVPKKLEGKGEFKIKTRAATMGVRGTEFVVNSPINAPEPGQANSAPPKTDVTVLQGKVDVAQAGASAAAAPIHLGAGSQLTTQLGAPPAATVQLNQTQMATVSTGSRVADNTFTKAVTIENNPEKSSSSSTSKNTATASNSSSSGTSKKDRAPAEASNNSSSSAESKSSAAAPSSTADASGGANASGDSKAAAAAPAAPAVGSMQATLANIAATAPTIPISFSNIGLPGAPSVQNVVSAPVAQQTKSSYHVTVVVGQ